MRLCAGPFRGFLLVAAIMIGAGAQAAVAQELQFDPKALDTSGAPATAKRGKGKKGAEAAASQAQQGASGKSGNVPNRQFGELEGWSPGKAPPKPKDKYDPDPAASSSSSSSGGKLPVGVSPTGNMSVGLPF
jgi:hypothetical protein